MILLHIVEYCPMKTRNQGQTSQYASLHDRMSQVVVIDRYSWNLTKCWWCVSETKRWWHLTSMCACKNQSIQPPQESDATMSRFHQANGHCFSRPPCPLSLTRARLTTWFNLWARYLAGRSSVQCASFISLNISPFGIRAVFTLGGDGHHKWVRTFSHEHLVW